MRRSVETQTKTLTKVELDMGRISWHGKKADQRTGNKLALHIGGQLLKARQKHQMTMRETSEKSGLSMAFICQVENSQSIPTAETLWKLSQCFEVPVGYWFRGYTGEDVK